MERSEIEDLRVAANEIARDTDVTPTALWKLIERYEQYEARWERCERTRTERQTSSREGWDTVYISLEWRCQLRKGDHYIHRCDYDKKEITWT